MSEELELLQNLSADTVNALLAQAKMFTERPTPTMKWHVCITSPLLGMKNYSFDDFDSMRRELTKVVKLLTLGKIFIYYGYSLPVTKDGSGQNLFVVNLEGQEVPITEGYNSRTPINDGDIGIKQEKLKLEQLI